MNPKWKTWDVKTFGNGAAKRRSTQKQWAYFLKQSKGYRWIPKRGGERMRFGKSCVIARTEPGRWVKRVK